jgi:hypothetical protein
LLSLLISGPALAADVSVDAIVDKNEVTLEDYILLKISVTGTRGKPVLPEIPAFSVQSRGSSSRVSIVNGQMSSSVEYSFLLYPRKTGVFSIGPFFVKHGGRKIESKLITIQVLKTQPQAKESRDIFITAEVDNDRPYLYEEIIYCFKFFRRVNVTSARLTESPSFEGFIAKNLGKEKGYRKTINGQEFVVTEIKQALFPTKKGVLEIAHSSLKCDVVVKKKRRRRSFFNDPFSDDSFFGFSETVPKVFRTSPITVMVQPLPAAGKPADFDNLVGDFRLSSELSTNKLEVGASATLTLTLSGTGNLKNNQAINIAGLQNFKVYDDKPVFEPGVIKGKVGGKLIIKKALVPLTAGSLKIPPISISYFNPDSAGYQTARTGPHILEVLPAKDKEKFQVVEALRTAATKEEVKILGHDILPIHTSLETLSTRRVYPRSLIIMGCFFLPIFGFAALLAKTKLQLRNEGDRGLVRARSAYKNFGKALPAIQKALKKNEAQFYQSAPKAFKDFIGDKLNISGSALTARELEGRLAEAGISQERIAELKRLLEFFDSGQFGFKKYSAEEKEAVIASMKNLVKKLNRKLKK